MYYMKHKKCRYLMLQDVPAGQERKNVLCLQFLPGKNIPGNKCLTEGGLLLLA